LNFFLNSTITPYMVTGGSNASFQGALIIRNYPPYGHRPQTMVCVTKISKFIKWEKPFPD
jgi:hypothetical protein